MRKRTIFASALVAGLALVQTAHSHHVHNVKKSKKLRHLEARDYYPAHVYSRLSIEHRAKVNRVVNLIVTKPKKKYNAARVSDQISAYCTALDYASRRDTVTAYDLALVTDLTSSRADHLTLAMSMQEILDHTARSIQTSDKRLAHGVNYSRRPKASRVLKQISRHVPMIKKHPNKFIKFLRNNVAYNMFD